MIRIRARHFETQQWIDVCCAREKIVSVEPPSASAPDLKADWITPCLFDLQINGCEHRNFCSTRLTPDEIRHVVRVCRSHGIGELLPTLITSSYENLVHGFRTLRQAREEDGELRRAIPGFHLEGPYISPEDGARGAHPKSQVRPPNWDEFCRLQEAAGGGIKLVTLAPETEGAIPFIEKLTAQGICIALGHTAASKSAIQAAIGAGAKLSTHLGNGSQAMLPRHDNYIWEQLAADDLWASLICDGHHLPDTLVKCFVRIKTPSRLILTCDAGTLAGLPPGKYKDWDQEFEVTESGKIVVPGTSYLAGSWAFTDLCLANVMRFAGVSLAEAVRMASERPRTLLDLPQREIKAGQLADLVLWKGTPGADFAIQQVVWNGEQC